MINDGRIRTRIIFKEINRLETYNTSEEVHIGTILWMYPMKVLKYMCVTANVEKNTITFHNIIDDDEYKEGKFSSNGIKYTVKNACTGTGTIKVSALDGLYKFLRENYISDLYVTKSSITKWTKYLTRKRMQENGILKNERVQKIMTRTAMPDKDKVVVRDYIVYLEKENDRLKRYGKELKRLETIMKGLRTTLKERVGLVDSLLKDIETIREEGD